MAYPCWRYHATEEPRRITSEAEENALGAGWHDSPKKAQAEAGTEHSDAPKPASILDTLTRRRGRPRKTEATE